MNKLNISLLLNTLFFFLLLSCSSTKNLIKKKDLSKEQIIVSGNDVVFGMCVEPIDGIWPKEADYAEIKLRLTICEREDMMKYFRRSQVELIRLGYTLVKKEYDENLVDEITKNAIEDFQNKNNLIVGRLDEATLRKLMSSKKPPLIQKKLDRT